MDLAQEIDNHLQWIDTIASMLDKESLSDDELHAITQHDNCALGHWMDSDASNDLKDTEEFKLLAESHDAFHRLAGDLIIALQHGNETETVQAQEQFLGMSHEVIGHLQMLQKLTEQD